MGYGKAPKLVYTFKFKIGFLTKNQKVKKLEILIIIKKR